MDELIKALREKYIKDLTSSFSLYKVAIFLLFLVALVVVSERGNQSLWFEIASIQVNEILSISSPFASKILLLHLILGAVFTYFTGLFYKKIQSACFNLFASLRDFSGYMDRLHALISQEVTKSNALNYYLVRDSKDELKLRKSSLVQIHIWGELILASSIISLIGLSDFNIPDLLIGLSALVLTWFIQRSSFSYYISKIAPALVVEGAFLDKTIEFGDSLDK